MQAFFDKFEDLQKPPFHPKWKDINLATTIPGWRRHPAVEHILHDLATTSQANSTNIEQVLAGGQRQAFEQFLVQRLGGRALSDQDRNQLFEQFIKWNQGRVTR